MCVSIRYTANRQPGKALPFYLRLRRPNVFELIREHNLFTDVQDQVLLLVEFDHELMKKRKAVGQDVSQSEAINLLVNNIHSIPVSFLSQVLMLWVVNKSGLCVAFFRSYAWSSSCRTSRIICFCTLMPWLIGIRI